MGLLASSFSRLDAAVQRGFDSTCFFLMRRFGTRKSTIRYGLQAFGIVGIATIAVHFGRLGYVMLAVILSLVMLLMLIGQYGALTLDREAEERQDGSRSKVDGYGGTGRTKIYAAATLILGCLLISMLPRHALAFLGMMQFDLAELLLMYLRKTPMNPPAERERESILSPQPAPAKL